MTLQQQLEYFWERGYYSKLVNKYGGIGIVSTKREDGIFRFSTFNESIGEAKSYLGASSLEFYDLEGCEIIGTVHPSELMGKGFQVGDKVTINLARDSDNGKEGVVESFVNDGTLINVRVRGILLEHIVPTHLKPVLPVEENKNCMKCGVYVSENDIGVIRTETDYLCCLSCDREVNKVIELLKKTKVITDGKIVNF